MHANSPTTSPEPSYSFLEKLKSVAERSQFGTALDLDKAYPDLVGEPLTINGKHTHGTNPNRYKQHGFHFNADNCIACHACESACSEKNNLPPHLAFRKVGYIEGGTYPDFMRLNVSMACNHCEDPVCLKGCPTRAYTKYAEYGAVLQDPNICFGCGYCTWVCPYNAPQLDPVKGQVEKCNMCIDRLEQGLKPACVAACLGNALEFGVIEDLPQGREQAKTQIPGFPDPTISRPNIRFQQIRSLPADFTRADGQPIHYQRDTQGAPDFHVKAREAVSISKRERAWGFDKLSSRENPLVIFTLLSQTVIGAFLWLFLGTQYSPSIQDTISQSWGGFTLGSALLFGLIALQSGALFLTTMHIGKPLRFYRGFNNLRHSWVSREGAALMVFFGFLGAYTFITSFPIFTAWLPDTVAQALPKIFGWGAVVMGPLALYCMAMIYRIKARPFWNHWHTQVAFFASLFILASITLGVVFGFSAYLNGESVAAALQPFALGALAGFVLQGVALYGHLRYLARRGAEADVSRIQMLTTYGKTYRARWLSLALLTLLTGAFALGALDAVAAAIAIALWSMAAVWAIAHETIGRALFYVLVTPTTMPGAFFWNNKYFEQHARHVGLAHMPQVGVVPDAH